MNLTKALTVTDSTNTDGAIIDIESIRLLPEMLGNSILSGFTIDGILPKDADDIVKVIFCKGRAIINNRLVEREGFTISVNLSSSRGANDNYYWLNDDVTNGVTDTGCRLILISDGTILFDAPSEGSYVIFQHIYEGVEVDYLNGNSSVYKFDNRGMNMINPIITAGLTITGRRTISISSAQGVAGEICFDNDYLYICLNTNQWTRVALTW
jgi:hypothetical protein